MIFTFIGFLFVLSSFVNSKINLFTNHLTHFIEGATIYMVFAIDRIVMVAVVAMLFSFIFKFLPDGYVKWKNAIEGDVFTSALFIIEKAGIGYYLVHFQVATMYGEAS